MCLTLLIMCDVKLRFIFLIWSLFVLMCVCVGGAATGGSPAVEGGEADDLSRDEIEETGKVCIFIVSPFLFYFPYHNLICT